ncbi:Cgl0159 family (beta/alpha)8-fold protein [Actinoplanes sp. CA-252034]|uniref:Cgl0159 family (beta/alpha)8-fold protein n=1 Tax=Actinoplanes sp. CA-252034 TaxID=3239906 RepID=UPI003D95C68A
MYDDDVAEQCGARPEGPWSSDDFAELRGLRATRPEAIAEAAARRVRRPLLADAGDRLMLVAADHPARGALGVRGDGGAMADRYELLRRLRTALRRPGVDGVLGTADVLEDLLLLGELDGKIAIGSMNRGGLQGAVFELDDRFTGYDAAAVARMRFDGGKMLVRIDPEDPASVRTLEASARAVDELAAHGLLAMVEPFLSKRGSSGSVVNDLSTAAVARSVAIAAGLGGTSAYTWLKLPVVDDMEAVMAATTMPALLLGGDPSGSPDETYASWGRALAVPGVRGLMVGRALLYPPDGDVAAAVDSAVRLVRSGVAA